MSATIRSAALGDRYHHHLALLEGAVRKKDQEQLMHLMSRLMREWRRGKLLPHAVFESLLKFCLVHVSVETVFLRRRKVRGRWQTQVFLIKRERGLAYGGLWHSPGSYMRQGERLHDTIARIGKGELAPARIGARRFAGIINYLDVRRGHTLSPIFACRLNGTPREGAWFDVRDLPTNIVDSHRDLIDLATQRLGRRRWRVAITETSA